mmetsp:Transcript_9260/g.25974  ORF Transcript_9260/g.25974 Transcript_9260/m.25974 type:complete len:104 (-) Transcript_9260:384-695(-)
MAAGSWQSGRGQLGREQEAAVRKNEELSIRWKVVGGQRTSGIFAREQESDTSCKCPVRLGIGTIVEEVQRIGDKIQFKKVSGDGPKAGWVGINIRGQVVLEQV